MNHTNQLSLPMMTKNLLSRKTPTTLKTQMGQPVHRTILIVKMTQMRLQTELMLILRTRTSTETRLWQLEKEQEEEAVVHPEKEMPWLG